MEFFVKVVAGVGGLFGLYKVIVDVLLGRSNKRREEYRITKNFIDDLENDEIHPYIIEKGFFAITGKEMSLQEIKYILSYESPIKAIDLKSDSGALVEFVPSEGYRWAGWYKNKYYQKISGKLFLAQYLIFGSFCFLPIYFGKKLDFSNTSIGIWLISLLIAATSALIQHEKIKAGKRFMNLKNPII